MSESGGYNFAGDDLEADELVAMGSPPSRRISFWDRLGFWERLPAPVRTLIVAAGVAGVGFLSTQVTGWAQDIANDAATGAVDGHEKKGAHREAATKADLAELKKDIGGKLDALFLLLTPMKKEAEEAAKDRAAVLCKALRKTEIRGSLCVLKKMKGRAKKKIELSDLKALRLEVYGE